MRNRHSATAITTVMNTEQSIPRSGLTKYLQFSEMSSSSALRLAMTWASSSDSSPVSREIRSSKYSPRKWFRSLRQINPCGDQSGCSFSLSSTTGWRMHQLRWSYRAHAVGFLAYLALHGGRCRTMSGGSRVVVAPCLQTPLRRDFGQCRTAKQQETNCLCSAA